MHKRNSKNNQRKTQKRKGGVIVNESISPDDAFTHFLENSTFKYFDRGFFGVLVLATLHRDAVRNYRSVRMCSLEPVTHLIIKLLKLEKRIDPHITVITPEDVDREISIQQNVYHSTFTNDDMLLEAICPCIVHSSTHMTPIEKEKLHSLIGKNDKRINAIFSAESVAYIAMEFMDGYVPLHTLEQSPRYGTYRKMSIHMLDKMHECGYLHRDFNGNVMIHETYNYYNLNQSGRAIVIDFGQSTYVENLSRMKMMEIDSNIRDPEILKMCDKLDELHRHVQKIGIELTEKRFHMKIKDIMKMFVFYRVGGQTMDKEKKETNKSEASKSNDDWPSDWTVDFVADDIEVYDGKTAEEYEADFKRINPAAYERFMNGINEVLEKQKKDPKYIEKLFAAQFTNLLVPHR